MSRYSDDVLAAGWQRAGKPTTVEVQAQVGLVVEEPTSGWVGAIIRWENGLFVLEDRAARRRSFSFGPGFWIDGRPVAIVQPKRVTPGRATHTASGSRVGEVGPAKVALPSRIYVEGRHDAELIEKIWGDDLRHVGVAVEYLGGIDDLAAIVAEFRPGPGRRLGVLVDHLVPGSKESRIAASIANDWTLVTGHQFIDIWQAILPARIGRKVWPEIPKGEDWKKGTCAALGWPHADQADIARVWRSLLGRVSTWRDLEPGLLTEVERLIDFVTADQQDEA
ncbi:MAG: DUF3097 domain-containing protein [Propionibacteriaceae bacterium]|nr:DUF3097 domain-containing protein [Micropruina sp.]HBX79737.1 DUF3097 domain-containing protein [Propionibacteriaceae bacterium]HBY24616.1 DUF3097 domain-containing protein [Propionibacteriaceae bacterium]